MKPLFDLHTHSISSGHAYSTISELTLFAFKNGLSAVGCSDHGPGMPGGAHPFHFINMTVMPRTLNDVFLLRGIEANVMNLNGDLDVEERVLKKVDYVICSLHTPCVQSGDAEENTDALINVMKKTNVKIIGHPDDPRFPLNYPRLVAAAKVHDIWLEINNSSLRPDTARKNAEVNTRILLEECKKQQVTVVLGSDAHYAGQVGDFSLVMVLIEELAFPETLIANLNIENALRLVQKD